MGLAEINSVEARVTALEVQLSEFVSKSKLPNELTKEQRELILDNIWPRIENNGVKYRTDKRGGSNYTAFQVGDFINHVDDVNKRHYAGIVLNATLSLPADFNDSAKIDKYNDSEPAL